MGKNKKAYSGTGWSFEGASDHPQTPKDTCLTPGAHRLKITTDRRKGNRLVSVAGPFQLPKGDMKALAKELKLACGSGGSFTTDTIEVQGEHIDTMRELLSQKGFGVKS